LPSSEKWQKNSEAKNKSNKNTSTKFGKIFNPTSKNTRSKNNNNKIAGIFSDLQKQN
jgi:hypothetical protein